MSYIGNSPGVASQRVVSQFTATSGQTTFTPISGYTIGYLDVFLNGIKLVDGIQYSANNGSTVVLTTGAALNDKVEVLSYTPRGLTDSLRQTEADVRYIQLTTSHSGDVTGIYNNLTLANSGVSAGSYGSSSAIPVLTIDSKGRVTSASTSSITVGSAGLTLSIGTAGATNTTVTVGTGTGFTANSSSASTYDIKVGPALTNLAALMTTAGAGFIKRGATADTYSIDTSTYLTGNQSITISGDVTGSGTTAITATLANSGVTAGTYNSGSTSHVPITIDSKGRITSTSAAVTITPAWSSITSTPTTISGYGITDAYTKTQVDSFLQGLDPKASAVVATTTNITLSGTQTIDGIAVVVGDRVLVKNQTTTADNGLYDVAAAAWTRTTDMNIWAEVPGAYVFIEKGATYADTGWVSTADAGGTLGTTAITWVQFAGAGTYTGTSPITITGTSISHAVSGVTAGTYNNVTVNATGHVTGGSNTSYLTAESDTLATVTGRGASTSTATTFSGGLIASGTTAITLSNATSNTITTGTDVNFFINTRDSASVSTGALQIRTGDASGTTTSAGGISLYAGQGTTATGANVSITGGNVNIATSTGGYVSIRGGSALTGASTAGTGGAVFITGGYAYAAAGTKTGGSVYIDGGSPFNAGTNVKGTVYIGTNNTQINDAGTAAVNIGSSTITVTISGTIKLPTVGTSGFVKLGAGGQLSADTSTYLTGNQSITISGDVTGSGTTAITATLANSGVTAGSYGSGSAIPVLTIDSKGRVTSASTSAVTIGAGALTLSIGTAGATNTTVTVGTGTGFTANSTTASTYDIKVGPALTNLAALMTTAGAGFIKRGATADTYSIDTSTYLTGNQSITISGDVTGSGTTAITATLAASGVTAGTYGSSTSIPQITVDSKGRITAVTGITTSGGTITRLASYRTPDITSLGYMVKDYEVVPDLFNIGGTTGTWQVTQGSILHICDLPSIDRSGEYLESTQTISSNHLFYNILQLQADAVITVSIGKILQGIAGISSPYIAAAAETAAAVDKYTTAGKLFFFSDFMN
jgi:hypothetical protein